MRIKKNQAQAQAPAQAQAQAQELESHVLMTKLEPFYLETREVHYLWSPIKDKNTDKYIVQLENQKMYSIKQANKNELTKTLFGAFPVTIDNTDYIKEAEVFQVPPNCKSERLCQKVFKPSEKSSVEWIFVYEGALLKEHYFYVPTNASINDPAIRKDLLWGLMLI